MNNRGDIVGYGWDKAREAYAPIVKPAGAGWRRLPNPGYADARKISDDGRVIGLAGSTQFDGGVVWDSVTAEPRFLPGKETSGPMVSAIRGPWVVGYEAYGAEWEFRGFRWPVNGEPATSFEGYDFTSVNVDGDVVTSAERHPEGSKLIRFDGTEITFDTPTDLRHLFDRGGQYTAAGAIGDLARPEAVVWKGC